jgi:hypothetical protein
LLLLLLLLLLLPVIIRRDNEEEGDGLFNDVLGVPKNCNNCFELELGIAASVVVNNENDNDNSIIAADKGDD